jgi:hypothetical protein
MQTVVEIVDVDSYKSKKRRISNDELQIVQKKPRNREIKPYGTHHLVAVPGQVL